MPSSLSAIDLKPNRVVSGPWNFYEEPARRNYILVKSAYFFTNVILVPNFRPAIAPLSSPHFTRAFRHSAGMPLHPMYSDGWNAR
jgi:hypothetical protein